MREDDPDLAVPDQVLARERASAIVLLIEALEMLREREGLEGPTDDEVCDLVTEHTVDPMVGIEDLL